MLQKILINIALVNVLLVLSACAAVKPLQEPEVSFAGLSISSLALDQQQFQLKFDVSNPNNQTIVIKSMDYVVTVAGKRLAEGKHGKTIRLVANAQQAVAIDVTTYLNDTLPLFGHMLAQPDKPLDYVFGLKLRLSRPVPFTYNISQEGVLDLFK
ncbi:MAG: LEA type 2 family protein [Gammaproteobacteria bacterium]|nr:LEA type 2 family protein [Gammaproteobacteria bacterium]